jgi:hypothetical protein
MIVSQLIRKFPDFYKNLKVHNCVHKRPPRKPILSQINPFHRVSCHHDMALPQVEDGREDFQIWRSSANISNKQSWIADI